MCMHTVGVRRTMPNDARLSGSTAPTSMKSTVPLVNECDRACNAV